MKLRIQSNHVRLRLSRGEVARLAAGQAIEQQTASLPQALVYRLVSARVPQPRMTFSSGVLEVEMPAEQVTHWAAGDEVSIESQIVGAGGAALTVLVEKDFQCLHGAGDDHEDGYPNPRAQS
jgi:hypothetical protein